MKMDLSAFKIHLVLCPVDMRSGFRSLSLIAETCLGIDVGQGRDCVVFMSSQRTICKAIWSDEKGHSLLTRRLTSGRFAKLLARAADSDALPITVAELMTFLDGESLQSVRSGFGQCLTKVKYCSRR